jgi:cytochrome bd-type quinol oxidase subunit 2
MDPVVLAMLLPSCFFSLYFILEAADWGICLAAPVVARNNEERGALLSLLKPGLDGNELWFYIGFYMLFLTLPDATQTGVRTWYIVMLCLVGAGALLRLLAAFLPRIFQAAVMMKGLTLFSFISLFLTGLLGTYILTGNLLSLAGICGGLWTMLACFQIGALYGAVKVVNPLGERLRAAFLVASCLSVLLYVIFVFALHAELGAAWGMNGYFWMSLVATGVLFLGSFFLTRSRYPVSGLAFAYAASFFAIAIYFSAYVTVIPSVHAPDLVALKAGMDAIPSAVLLGISAVWTLATFVWRLWRKKVVYVWEDHI